MDISNLQIGQKIKNYKELCSVLNEKIKGGDAKKSQLKELERLCKYHKDGNAFIIDEIYETQRPKKILMNNSKYISAIEDILITYIYNNCRDHNTLEVSFSSLIKVLGLANNSYKNANSKKNELSEVLNIGLPAVYYFYDKSRGEFRRIVERALNNLQKRSILEVDKRYTIAEDCGDTFKFRKASEEERGLIIDARYTALRELGFTNLQQLKFSNVSYRRFYGLVKKYLPKEWAYYYDAYVLVIGQQAILKEYISIQKERMELNLKAIERMNTLLKGDRNSDQFILIDKLINLSNYSKKFDEKINELYIKNKAEFYKSLEAKRREISRIKLEINNLILRDEEKKEVDKIQLQAYAETVKKLTV